MIFTSSTRPGGVGALNALLGASPEAGRADVSPPGPPGPPGPLHESALQALDAAHVPASRITCAYFVPGRIEVVGKHTDYAGGRSLTAAAARGICVAVAAREDDRVTIIDAGSRESVAFRMDDSVEPAIGWPIYPRTVARRIARNFPAPLAGADIAFASDLPAAAGMSSSSALVIASFLALASVNRLAESAPFRGAIRDTEGLATYLSCIENGASYGDLEGDRGAGTEGGSEDHVAILCARPDHLLLYSYAPVRFEAMLAMPEGHVFAIATSGVRAEKAGAAQAAYNRAAELARIATAIWCDGTGFEHATLGAALEVGPGVPATLRAILRRLCDERATLAELLDRVEHFITESNEIVPLAAVALAAGDLEALGEITAQSQALATTHLHNQVPETEHLARSARGLGAVAASAFGAGFGGSVWALVPEEASGQFLREWRADYAARFAQHAAACDFFTTRAAGPAVRIL